MLLQGIHSFTFKVLLYVDNNIDYEKNIDAIVQVVHNVMNDPERF